jgi:4-hydroxybenzoate polyprenyltransferase
MGTWLLLCGVACGWVAQALTANPQRGCTGLVATSLACCVLLYDGGLKRTLLGPPAMGCCRLLNVLLGMSADPRLTFFRPWPAPHLWAACGVGLYVVGVTWFARREAETSGRGQLTAACGVMVAGLACLASLPTHVKASGMPWLVTQPMIWPALLFLLALPVVRRSLRALTDTRPERVQAAVKQALITLILLDAAICLAIAGPIWALCVVGLLAPAQVLGRYVAIT